MQKDFEAHLAELFAHCRQHIRSGQIALYAQDLKEMAALFGCEKRYLDQLKMLFLAFYIDLSGLGKAPYIDRYSAEHLREAAAGAGMDRTQLEHFFLDLIDSGMVVQHPLSVKESWYLLNLCLDGKVDQAQYVLSKV